MAQAARNLTDAAAGPLTGVGNLIVDRDPLYTTHFRTLLQAAGVQRLRLPSRSPNLNAYAERFVRAIKHECLRHIIPVGERHLRAVVREFMEHYHAERNHQGLGNVIPAPGYNFTRATCRSSSSESALVPVKYALAISNRYVTPSRPDASQ
jgi:putative transposase